MKNTESQKYGIGLEMEGFIVDGDRGKERIDGVSSAEWIINQVRERVPKLSPYLSLEQASVMLEVKTDVFNEDGLAIKQVEEIRSEVNKIIEPKSCKLVFEPVLKNEFEFVAASSDPSSRTHLLINDWSRTPEGRKMLYSTAVASLQINDSRPFQFLKSDSARYDAARNLHNLYSSSYSRLAALNDPTKVDYNGLTRMQNLFHLLKGVKAKQFLESGYVDSMQALIPPYFRDLNSMKRWMAAHSGVENFADAKCKNEHAVTIKIKRDPYWALETRVFDACDDVEKVKALVRFNNNFLRENAVSELQRCID